MTPLRLEHRPLHDQLIMQNIKKFNKSESFISWKGRTLVRFLKHYTLCKTVLLNIDSLQSRVYFAQGFSYAIYMRNASETREMRACEHSGSRQILSYDRSLKVRVCEIPTGGKVRPRAACMHQPLCILHMRLRRPRSICV